MFKNWADKYPDKIKYYDADEMYFKKHQKNLPKTMC